MKKWIALIIVVVLLLSFGAYLEQSKSIVFAWTVREVTVMYDTEELKISDGATVQKVAGVVKNLKGEESEAAERYTASPKVETPVVTFYCKTFFGDKIITVHGGKYLVHENTCLELSEKEQTALKGLLQELFPQ